MAAQTNHLIYSSATAESLAAAYAVYKWHTDNGHTLTVYDIVGIITATLTTYCGTTLVDATYDAIYITAPCEATSQTTPVGTINCTQQYALRAKLKVASQGTLSALIEGATTHTATTIGDSAITDWTTDLFVDEHILITAGTGANQLSRVKSNTTTVATIRGIFYAVPDATSDFKTCVGMELYLAGKADTNTSAILGVTERTWTALYPDNTIPLLLSYFAGYPGYAVQQGTTCTSIGIKTLEHTAQFGSVDSKAGMYVQIYSATTNGYQWGLIESNTANILTLVLRDATHGWNLLTTPTGTPAYKIVNQLSDIFNDLYAKYYILTYLTDLSSTAVLAEFKRIIDVNDTLAILPAGFASIQDVDYIHDTILPTGKKMFDALRLGVTA